MNIDENEFRLACQLKDKDWLIEKLQAEMLEYKNIEREVRV